MEQQSISIVSKFIKESFKILKSKKILSLSPCLNEENYLYNKKWGEISDLERSKLSDKERLKNHISPSKNYRPVLFPTLKGETKIFYPEFDKVKSKTLFDLILGDIPFGLKDPTLSEILRLGKSRTDHELILYFSRKLTPSGIGIFTVTPNGFTDKFVERMKLEGIFIDGYIQI